jgi:hypothetical protein
MFLLGAMGGASWADDGTALIGRVSAVAGAAQYRSVAGDWSAAQNNEPVAAGTGLRTAAGAETDIHMPGARVALAPASELQVLRFDGVVLQIALSAGRTGIHLDAGGVAKTVEIDLPQGGVWLTAPGDYDIYAGDGHAPAAVQVFTGVAQLGGGLDDRSVAAASPDWFSDWWRSQGDTADRSDPRPWPQIPGFAALADAGTWKLDPKLGNVWFPSDVAADWAPYRDGAWRYVAPWGWTWIDNAPWGFAPSHFGRWARLDDRWAWVPGERLAVADYRPAIVAFLGTAGIGLSRPGDIGAMPAIAWFPLAPGETIGDADGDYRNRRFATAVPRDAFASGQPVAAAQVSDIPAQRFADAPVILDALSIPPARTASAATKKPLVVAAAADNSAASSDLPETTRQPFFVTLRDAPPRAPARQIVREIRRRVHVAIALHSRAAASTSAFHPAHNRQHFAAARRGA